jgi:hypothetical protein
VDAEPALGTTVDDAPEGKIVARIDTVRLDPIEARDPLPTVLDTVHTTTEDDVIRQEVLLSVGEPYRLEETNLAGRQQSLTAQVFMQPKSPASITSTPRNPSASACALFPQIERAVLRRPRGSRRLSVFEAALAASHS